MTTPKTTTRDDSLKGLFFATPQDKITLVSVGLALTLASGLTLLPPTIALGIVAAGLISMRKIAKAHGIPMLFKQDSF